MASAAAWPALRYGPLDDYFVRADAVHLVENAFTLFVQPALDLERRELVRHGPEPPVRSVGLAVGAVGKRFVRRGALVAAAKGAEASPFFGALVLEFHGAFPPFR
jgi:hypothetical protein